MSWKTLGTEVERGVEEIRSHTPRQILNTVLNRVESRLQRPVVRSYPQNVDVVLTKSCNLACTFCKDYETEGAKKVSQQDFERVAHQLFPTARWLRICSGGEPYLHKGLEDLLRVARRYQVSTWVLSNGMLIKEERIRPMLRERLVSLHGFSVDGFKASTVESLRVNANLEVILDNIRMFLRVRQEEGHAEPRVVIRYALMRSNIEELPDSVQRWGEMGIDRLDGGYLSVANGISRDESLFFHQELAERVFTEARRVAKKYPRLRVNLPGLVRDELPLQQKPKLCHAPWSFVNIDTDGRVLPCYRAFEAMNMGNMHGENGQRFDELWNQPAYQSLRATVNDDTKDKHFPYCARCEYRFGWGDVGAHLGDETWLASIGSEKAEHIDHRRRKTKVAP